MVPVIFLSFLVHLKFKVFPVFRIHRIHMFLGLPDPDPFVIGMDLDPDSSIIKQTSKKNLDSYCFVTSFGLYIFENYVNVPSKRIKQNFFLN
jgi:hypothetical protein